MDCWNCGGRSCIACALGQEHNQCENDCPECCNQPLWDDQDDYDREGEGFGY